MRNDNRIIIWRKKTTQAKNLFVNFIKYIMRFGKKLMKQIKIKLSRNRSLPTYQRCAHHQHNWVQCKMTIGFELPLFFPSCSSKVSMRFPLYSGLNFTKATNKKKKRRKCHNKTSICTQSFCIRLLPTQWIHCANLPFLLRLLNLHPSTRKDDTI